MQDLIDRQEAIDAMRQYSYFNDFDVSVIDEDIAVIALKDLPSAQPERPKGKWIHYDEGDFDYDYKCSNCGSVMWDNSDFCPNCGADMREDDHETD